MNRQELNAIAALLIWAIGGLVVMPPAVTGFVLGVETAYLSIIFLFHPRLIFPSAVLLLAVYSGAYYAGYIAEITQVGWLFLLNISVTLLAAYIMKKVFSQKGYSILLDGGFALQCAPYLVPLSLIAGVTHSLNFSFGAASLEHMVQQTLIIALLHPIVFGMSWMTHGRPRRYWRKHGHSQTTIGITAIGLTSLILVVLAGAEVDKVKAKNNADLERLTKLVSQQIQVHTNAILAMKGFFETRGSVTREEFDRFSRYITINTPGMAALEWVPYVKREDIYEFEARMAAVVSGYKIWRHEHADSYESEYIYPVAYVYPADVNSKAYGLDMASEPNRRDAVERARKARDGEQTVVSSPVLLVQDDTPVPAYIEVISLFDDSGAVAGVVRVRDVLHSAISQAESILGELHVEVRGKVTGIPVYEANNLEEWVPHVSSEAEVLVGDRGGIVKVKQALFAYEPWSIANHIWQYILAISLAWAITMMQYAIMLRQLFTYREKKKTLARERALRRTDAYLRESEKMASLGAMVAGITHEVNTPLQVALMGLHNLGTISQRYIESAGDAVDPEIIARFSRTVERVDRNIKQAGALINDFKVVSSETTTSRISRTTLKDVIERAVSLLQPKLDQAGVSVELNSEDDVTLTTRVGPLSQVLINLVDNSMMHGFAESWGDKQIRISWSRVSDEEVVISYQDNGCGIKEHLQDKIFDAFMTTKEKSGGTGLGLYLSNNIVEKQLHGEITLQPSEEGAKFVILIPSVLED